MMDMKRKIIFSISVLLLMSFISSASVLNAGTIDADSNADELYVDSNIYLDSENLNTIEASLNEIEDPILANAVGDIINHVENTGYANANDIQTILTPYIGNFNYDMVLCGRISGSACGEVWIPFGLKAILPGGFIWTALYPHLIYWSTSYTKYISNDITVAGTKLPIIHSAKGIGFMGYAGLTIVYVTNHPEYNKITINGFAPLIFISSGGDSLHSSPSSASAQSNIVLNQNTIQGSVNYLQ